MKKGKTIRQTLDILIKIFAAFVMVFVLYLISKSIEEFAYNYFIFPFISIIIIFICGINVGRSLEKIKKNKPIGFFTKTIEKENKETKTEFTIKDNYEIVTSKKILKEAEDGDKVHIKTFNYNDINFNNDDREDI